MLKPGNEQSNAIQITEDTNLKVEADTEIVQADCCNPIPGDDIIGFRHFNQIIIHRTSCSKAKELSSTYGHKMVKIKWNETNSVSFFVTLKLTGIDKIGIIRDVSRAISEELNVNIRSFHLESKNNIFEGEIKLYISDIQRMKELIRNLVKIEGVKQVFRVE
jgi:GTP pyrophosphokinase